MGLHFAKKINEKDFPYKEKMSEMGLEPEPKWAKFIFSNFLLNKNLDKKFWKKKFLLMKGKKGVNFLMKTDSKHQWEASVSMADSNYH